MLVAVLGAKAQVDSARIDTMSSERPLRPHDVDVVDEQPPQPSNDNYNNADPLIRVRLDAIPSSMRRTLQGGGYSGWDQLPIYQDKNTLEYSIDIRSGDSLKTFRFDKFGNPVNVNSPDQDQ